MATVKVKAAANEFEVCMPANYVAKMLKDMCKVVAFCLEVQAVGGTVEIRKVTPEEEKE